MDMTTREFLKKLGLGGAALAGGGLVADEYVKSKQVLPEGAIGDPGNYSFAKNIFPLPHTIEDGPSCALQDGRIVQPAREIPLFHTTDVVVVGGGPAGFAAAVAAARTGAKVALLERYASLGGLFTNGMVLIMLATSLREKGKPLRLVTKGLCEEFMQRARAEGEDACTPLNARGNQPTVDPECAKYLMDRMVAESKIDMFFHCWGVDTVQQGDKVVGVVFESKQGRQGILAKQVVDCTGDGDVLFQAGGDYRQITHDIGHCVRLANMDRITATQPPKDADGKPLPGKWPTRSNEGNPATWWGNFREGVLDRPSDGLNVRALSENEVNVRKWWWEHVRRMRKTPGWEQVFLANTSSISGPRATRIIAAEQIVDRAYVDSVARGDVPDCIGLCGADGPHNAFKIPYRQLVPKKVDNLLCAGRMLGAPNTIDTFRLICPCFVTGQAAGTAAALAARAGCTPRELDVCGLQAQLVKDGVCLA